ncbi:MAG: helix-turn-helix domain-containing protein [Nitrospiraceae bacterium]
MNLPNVLFWFGWPRSSRRSLQRIVSDLHTAARGATRHAERARILQALQHTGSNHAKAAKLLKISRASLYNKLRTYGMRDARSVTPQPALREAPVFTP